MTKISGVYSITCADTGKKYVGSSCDIDNRWKGHTRALNANTHRNGHLQRAWVKHGADNFAFVVLEETLPDVRIARELDWVRSLEPEFNIRPPDPDRESFKMAPESRKKLSASHMGKKGVSPSQETRRLLSIAVSGKRPPHTPERCRNLSKALTGRKATDEHKRNMSKALKGHTTSEETRRKISEAHLKRAAQLKKDSLTIPLFTTDDL